MAGSEGEAVEMCGGSVRGGRRGIRRGRVGWGCRLMPFLKESWWNGKNGETV